MRRLQAHAVTCALTAVRGLLVKDQHVHESWMAPDFLTSIVRQRYFIGNVPELNAAAQDSSHADSFCALCMCATDFLCEAKLAYRKLIVAALRQA